MNWFPAFFPQTIERSDSSYNKSIEVIRRFGKNELYVNGIQQSGPYTIRLWKTGLREVLNNPPMNLKNILVLGVGGGTLFGMLHKVFPEAKITGVDIDKEIIRLYSKYFNESDSLSVALICNDAGKFVAQSYLKKQLYDLVIIDLYIGDDVPEFVSGSIFLSAVKKILAPHGFVVFNYFSLQNQTNNSQLLLDKLKKIYQSVISKDILRNKFFYCS